MVEANRVRVLVVDDEPGVIEDYRYMLSPLSGQNEDRLFSRIEDGLLGGAEPRLLLPVVDLVAHLRSEDAIQEIRTALASNEPFSVAFIDTRMPPGLGGIRCAATIRALDAQIQIVMIAGNTDVHPMDIVERVPPADKIMYLQKPFHAHEIQHLAFSLSVRWRIDRQPNLAGTDAKGSMAGRPGLPTTLQRLPAGIAIFDRQDRLLSWNHGITAMFPELANTLAAGVQYSEIVDLMASRLLPTDTLHRPDAWMRDYMAWHAGADCQREVRLRGPVWILIVENVAPTGETYCLFCDVTLLKKRETSREIGVRMTYMAHTVAAICEQAAGPSGPLGPIPSRTEAVPRGEDRMSTNDKLQAVSQQLALKPVVTDVRMLLRKAAQAIEDVGAPTPEVTSDAGLWPIMIDPTPLLGVLIEVAINGCEAAGESGQVQLEAANVRAARDFVSCRVGLMPGDYTRISIRDDGPGMSSGLSERAINPYFTTKSGAQHLGLGLSAAYGFTHQSGGYTEIESLDGHGTTVHFYFPRMPDRIAVQGMIGDPPVKRSDTPAAEGGADIF